MIQLSSILYELKFGAPMTSKQFFVRIDNFDREKLSCVGSVYQRNGWGKGKVSWNDV